MLDRLKSIVQEVNAARNLGDVLEIIVAKVHQAMEVQVCSIYLKDTATGDFVLTATHGLNKEAVGVVRMKARQGLVGRVASKAEPLNLDDAESHPDFAYFAETGEERYRSFLGSPIIHHGEVFGVLVVQQAAQRRFNGEEEAFLVTVCAQLAGIIAHARATGLFGIARGSQKWQKTEVVFTGVPSSPGIVIGNVALVAEFVSIEAVPIRKSNQPKREMKKFRAALEAVKDEMKKVSTALKTQLNASELALFDVYVSLLDDQSLGGEVAALIDEGYTAQSAWGQVIRDHVRQFECMEDAYLRDRAFDIEDLGRRVLRHLSSKKTRRFALSSSTILVGDDLAATAFADVQSEKVGGVVAVRGSQNSHMSIVCRALGIPAVMGVLDLPWGELDGVQVVVDGHRGQVIVRPDPETLKHYKQLLRDEKLLAKNLQKLAKEPSVLRDGTPLSLQVNTGLRFDVQFSLEGGADGVGLYRSEVPFMMRKGFPTEDEQVEAYREQLQAFAPKPVTMRTLDIGGDKDLPYFSIQEENPYLGWRGIRVSLDHPEIFLTQIRAMMRASVGTNNLRILLPMVTSIEELELALEYLYRVYDELTEEEGYKIEMPKVGVMVEVPALIYQLAGVMKHIDFLSVGTNDLTQYLLAVDRNNSHVAELYQSYHPSVLAALYQIRKKVANKPCELSVCGELAGDPIGALLLVGLGYRTLSMSATNLLRIKAILRQTTVEEASRIARRAMRFRNADEVREFTLRELASSEMLPLLN